MKLAFGLMRLPTINGDDGQIDLEKFKKMVDCFIEAGGTYFDTAYVYHKGESENFFRKAIAERYERDKYTITDKMPIFMVNEKEDLERIFNDQLKKTGVDYFDYYWLHALSNERMETVDKVDAFGFISQKKNEGKIRHIGFSFHDTADVLDKILTDHPEVEFVQLQINYIDWYDDINVQSKQCYDVCVKHNKKVMVMEPIKGGKLANVPEEAEKLMKDYNPNASVASWAIRFVASLENVERVLSGMSTLDQVKDNTSYMKDFKPLNDEEKQIIDKVVEIIKSVVTIPCTGCRYCVEENSCPMNICIPDYFALYNDKKAYNMKNGEPNERYKKLMETNGKASECIECGMCEEHCPQHLQIREFLKTINKEVEAKLD